MWHIYIYEKEMAINSNILAWKILWTEEATGYSPWGHKETAMTQCLSICVCVCVCVCVYVYVYI